MTASASDAPVRARGLRTRSGNAMLRTRTAILDAAALCVAASGARRTTMSQIAARGGVAKATLYNHFRTKDDVLAALVEARVGALTQRCEQVASDRGLAAALDSAAEDLAAYAPLRRVATEEPGLLAPLSSPGDGPRWEQVRAGVAAVLRAGGAAAGPAQVELVLRWALSQLLWPSGAGGSGAVLARVLDVSPPGASAVPPQGRPEGSARPTGLGWPGEPDTLRTR